MNKIDLTINFNSKIYCRYLVYFITTCFWVIKIYSDKYKKWKKNIKKWTAMKDHLKGIQIL